MDECEHCNMLIHTHKYAIGELKSPWEKCASTQIYVFIKLDPIVTPMPWKQSLYQHTKMILDIEEDTDYLILKMQL